MGSGPMCWRWMWRALALTFLAPPLFVAPAGAAVRFGVEGALGTTQLTRKISDLTDLEPSRCRGDGPSTTGEIGLTAEVPLPGPWALTGGLAYSPLSDRYRLAYTSMWGALQVTTMGTMHTHLRMLALPLRAEWRHGAARFALGPEVRYLVDAKRDIRNIYSEISVPSPNLAEPSRGRTSTASALQFGFPRFAVDGRITDLYERWSFAASAAIGVVRPVDRHAVRVDLRWSEGLTNVSRIGGVSERTRAVQFGVGFLW
jgi:hypothetical protein